MDGRIGHCTQKNLTLIYPKHCFNPEDMLHFIESTDFMATWDQCGFDLEDDLESLQLCIMANPLGDVEIEDTGGLRKHEHSFDWADDKDNVTAYYAYFEEYGIAYMCCLDPDAGDLMFTNEERMAIRESLANVKRELDRVKRIR
jgi:hypothetical protein